MAKRFITCCPECGEEACEVIVERSDSGFTGDFETTHWFEGQGNCEACGWEGPISDCSH